MKTTIKIMKNELRMLFCSPIAWIVLVIFFFHCGSTFCEVLETNLKWAAQGSGLGKLTNSLFVGYKGLFTVMLNKIFIYFPLLTMGIMSKEYSEGSISLLYSSPVSNRKIMWGKYLALVSFSLSFIAIFLIFIIYSLIVIPHFEIGLVLAGLLGFILMCFAYSAIGLFMSCLTRYQVVAAIGTFAVLALLNSIGSVGQQYPFIREITYWFAINDRTSYFILGMIRSEDVIYFLVIIAMFLSLTLAKLHFDRSKKSAMVKVGRYVSIVLSACVLGYVSSRPKMVSYIDLTSNKSNTLTRASQNVMRRLEGPMTITTYVNLLDDDPYGFLPKNFKSDTRIFANYLRFKPDIKLKYVYYYHDCENHQLDVRFPKLPNPEDRAKIIARGYRLRIESFLNPAQIDSLIDLSGEEYFTSRQISCNGKTTFLRMFRDMQKYPGEAEITAAMSRLTDDPIPVIAFAAKNGERSIYHVKDRDFYTFGRNIKMRHALTNQGFNAEEIDLTAIDRVPDNVLVLVLADPEIAYDQHELSVIKEFIARGGDMVIAAGENSRGHLNPVMAELGLMYMDGIVVKEQKENTPDFLVCDLARSSANITGGFAYLRDHGFKVTSPKNNPIGQFRESDFNFVPIYSSDSTGCWIEKTTKNFIDKTPVLDTTKGEMEWNGQPLMLGAVRETPEKFQKIIIMGSADCISNAELGITRKDIKSANFNLILETAKWFTDGQYPVNVSRTYTNDNEIKARYEHVGLYKAIFIWFFSLLLAATGSIICIRRYRY